MKRIIQDSSLAPSSLERARRRNVSWDEFSLSEAGKGLRQLKSDEQHGFCGYCECRLAEPQGTLPDGVAHIDHFYQKSRCPDKTYLWENLILSCKRNDSCGFFKDRQNVLSEELLNPTEDDPRDYFVYTWNKAKGRIFISPKESLSDAEKQKAQRTIDALNLNCDRLCQARGSEWLKHEPTAHCLLELRMLQESDSELSVFREELLQEMEQGEYSSAMVCMARDSW